MSEQPPAPNDANKSTAPTTAAAQVDAAASDGSAPNAEGVAAPAAKKAIHRPEIVQITLSDKAAIYSAYMPFVKNGGLFIRTNDRYEMGDEIVLLLKLMEATEKYTVRGKVIWMTPKGAQGGLQTGVGIQFAADTPKEVRNKIETYLAGSAQSDRRTDTM